MDITVRIRLVNSREEVLFAFEGGQKVIKGNGSSFIKPLGCGLPGGRKKPSETPRAAAIRELMEETGLEADIDEVPMKIVLEGDHQIWLFNARNPRGELYISDERIHALRWVNWKLAYGDIKVNDRRYPIYESHMQLVHCNF